MKAVILVSAKRDLGQLRAYILKNFSQHVWLESYDQIKAAIRHLASFPLLGSLPPELEDLQMHAYRQLICGMNRIIYEVRDDTVYIHMVVDTRRDLTALLARRLLDAGTRSV